MTLGDWRKTCQEAGIKMTHTESRSPWQNRTEVEIRELKRHVRRLMSRTQTPHKLWDFCCTYTTELRNRLARPLPQLHGRTPYEIISGNTPDISEFLEYEWYQPVWYYEPSTFPEQEKHLARWIGIAHRVGQAMCYWLLPKSGIPIARTTIQAISEMELSQDNIKEQLKDYDEVIRQKLSTENDLSPYIQLYREDCEDDLIDDKELPESKEVDSIEPDMYDELLMTQPMLIRDGRMERATIIGRKRDNDGNLIGEYDINPLSNTRVYLAEFQGGLIAEYSANTVVEAIYNDVNDDGYNEAFLVDIIGHERTNEAITNMEAGQNTRYTTKGWNICLSWDDGSTSWHTLSDVKNSLMNLHSGGG